METVTFDSTVKPNDPIVQKAIDRGFDVAYVSVSVREAKGTDFEISFRNHKTVSELGVWGEGEWGRMRWGDETTSQRFEAILSIISNGSFPKRRENLTEGESHQLRDALVLEGHIAHGRHIFVSNDAKGFINDGKREKLEQLFTIRIFNHSEFSLELEKCPLPT